MIPTFAAIQQSGEPLEFRTTDPSPRQRRRQYYAEMLPSDALVGVPPGAEWQAEYRAIGERIGVPRLFQQHYAPDRYTQELARTVWHAYADGWAGAVLTGPDGTVRVVFPATVKGWHDWATDFVAAGLDAAGMSNRGWRYVMGSLLPAVFVLEGAVSAADVEAGRVDNTQLLIDTGLLGPQTMVLRTTGVDLPDGTQEVVDVVAAGEDAVIPDTVVVPRKPIPTADPGAVQRTVMAPPGGPRVAPATVEFTPSTALLLAGAAALLLFSRRRT